MKIPDLTITDLVKNIIAVAIIGATVVLYVMQGVNPDITTIPTELKLASAAVLAAYGYQVVSTEKTRLSAAAKKPKEESEV
jgi:hypothetical protein